MRSDAAATDLQTDAARRESIIGLIEAIEKYGGPLATAISVREVERRINETVHDPGFPRELLSAFRDYLAESEMRRLPSVDSQVEAIWNRFGRKFRGLLRQGVEVSYELATRMTGLLPPDAGWLDDLPDDVLDPESLGRAEKTVWLSALRASAGGLALAWLLRHGDTDYSTKVVETLVREWFDGHRSVLSHLDPMQKALDDARNRLPLDQRRWVMRLTYALRPDSEGKVVLTVWVVFRDNTPEEQRAVVGDPKYRFAVAEALFADGIEHDFIVRSQIATEAGPIKEFFGA